MIEGIEPKSNKVPREVMESLDLMGLDYAPYIETDDGHRFYVHPNGAYKGEMNVSESTESRKKFAWRLGNAKAACNEVGFNLSGLMTKAEDAKLHQVITDLEALERSLKGFEPLEESTPVHKA